MRKIKFMLLLPLAFSLLSSMAQITLIDGKTSGSVNRDAEYGCPQNSLFSQLPSVFYGGYNADNSVGYTRAADDYTVTGPFTTMRFWGANVFSCSPETSPTFNIRFYERNPSDPTIPGAEVLSFNVTGITQSINLAFGNDYQCDVTFPQPVTLLDGWVSLTRLNPGDGCMFVWLSAFSGGNEASWNDTQDQWQSNTGSVPFCLGGGELQSIPISNWALFIGIGLILVFAVMSFRKLV